MRSPDPAERTDPGVEPCVWMRARLVAYKLCDRDFDCEHCAFDAAMQGALPRAGPDGPGAAHPDTWDFPGDRAFHPGHTWVQAGEGGQVRVGLDAFAAALIRPAGPAILPPPGTRLEVDQPGCWLADESGPLPLRMPVTGRLTHGNEQLRRWPNLVSNDPYGSGWLLEMEAEHLDQDQCRLWDPKPIRKKSDRDWRTLTGRIESLLHTHRGPVGPTMQDGGERLMDLRGILGAQVYRELVLSFL